ncbi:MAG TPA: ABC transporter permease [Vicinamibacterales bacterium]|nr:ABC transporter permease [Vicinamibacterales bacterium]
MAPTARNWSHALAESASLAADSVRIHPARSGLAISGIVIGIVTVVLVASVLANLRNQVALLFRELGTENVFAFHLTGDPYSPASEDEVRRRPLRSSFAAVLAREGSAIREVGVQLIVPPVVNGRVLTARAGDRESDTVLVEGASANFFDVVGAEFAAGRPFTDLEDRAGARVAVIGASLARALYGARSSVGKSLTLAGETYFVVGEIAPRKGGFFGENRQDSVLAMPVATATRRFAEAENVVLYARALPGLRAEAYGQVEAILRRLRGVRPDEPSDFSLSTADQIIRSLDAVSAQVGLVTIALAAVSLLIGGIGIANVQIISARERTREIGVRLAVGAPRRDVLNQFLLEAAILSVIGGFVGVAVAFGVGLLLALVVSGFSAVPPAWAVASGIVASLTVGIVAGYWPARHAASLDPVEALRYE